METRMQTAVAYGQSKEVGIYALASVVNALAADGVTEPVVQVRIIIPEYAYKSRMHTMEKCMKKICEEQGIRLQDVKSERSNVITQSMVVVTGAGECNLSLCIGNKAECGAKVENAQAENAQAENAGKNVRDGRDIVMTKWIGMEGMLRILDEKEADLKSRFSAGFLRQIRSWKSEVFAGKEIELARKSGAKLIRQVGEGGIFAALWNLAKETECGLEVDLKKIPVLQETVEVCEFFRLNPYQLASAGTMLMVAADGEKLVDELHEQGVPAVLVGKLTDNNDKILRNGEEIRYIDRPAPDEIMKIF